MVAVSIMILICCFLGLGHLGNGHDFKNGKRTCFLTRYRPSVVVVRQNVATTERRNANGQKIPFSKRHWIPTRSLPISSTARRLRLLMEISGSSSDDVNERTNDVVETSLPAKRRAAVKKRAPTIIASSENSIVAVDDTAVATTKSIITSSKDPVDATNQVRRTVTNNQQQRPFQQQRQQRQQQKLEHYRSNNSDNTKYAKRPYNSNNNNNFKSNNNGVQANVYRQFNNQLVATETADELLTVLQNTNAALTQYAGGKALNSVNFSTSLHRLARRSTLSKSDRATVLMDPRFALLVASLAEALASSSSSSPITDDANGKAAVVPIPFQSRELSNVAWALAKLQLAPPSSAMPMPAYGDDDVTSSLPKSVNTLVESAQLIRQKVFDAAKDRHAANQNDKSSSVTAASWIPQLSQLAGRILDHIGTLIIAEANEGGGPRNNDDVPKKSIHSDSHSKRKPFRIQEWANLLWAWATAGRANSIVFGIVVRNMIQQQREKQQQELQTSSNNGDDDILPQEWSNSIWAFATAQIYDGHEELLSFVAELMEDRKDFVNNFKSQELSNTAWGIATLLSNKPEPKQYATTTTNAENAPIISNSEQQDSLIILRHIANALILRRAAQFRTQELSNTAWAFATVGFGLVPTSENNVNNYVVLASDRQQEDAKLVKDAIDVIVEAAFPVLGKFRSQELNNLTWTLARLVEVKSNRINELLRGIALQIADRRRIVTSQDIGTTIWGLATLEFFDEQIYRGIASRLTLENAYKYKPQELSNTLWAFATAEMEVNDKDFFDTTLVPKVFRQKLVPSDPITACFAIAAQELMARPQQFKSQEIKDVLWSFSKVGIRHPHLFKSVAGHLVGNEDDKNSMETARGLHEFSTQGLGNCAWAYARQAQLSEDVSERLNGQSSLPNSNGRLAVYTTSYFDIGENLLQRFFKTIAETDVRMHDELRRCKPQDLSNTCWSFAVLGMKHTGFLEAAKVEIVKRMKLFVQGERNSMTIFKGQELANLVWSLATLNEPAGNLLEHLAPYLREMCKDQSTGKAVSQNIAKYLKRQELANMAWACAVFGSYPRELMQYLYVGLMGTGKEQNPAYMSSLHGDGGLQLQAIMTLVYVQAAMDLEGSSDGLALPDKFPDGWQQSSSSRNAHDGDILLEKSFELNLSTSRIQRSVSTALTRIGFNHVEEHTITMKEMAEVYNINVPPKDMEILSIDISNLDDKIGIEVDGPAHFISRIDSPSSATCGYTKAANGKIEYKFGWNGGDQETNGPTFLKHRLLNSFGWKVLHVPFWEWYALGGDATKEDDYCRRLLSKNTKS